MIYFIKCKNNIKIGYTDLDVTKRISALQTGNPFLLSLELLIDGDEITERTYHKLFARYRKNGEWFRYGWKLRLFILLNRFRLISYTLETEPITTDEAVSEASEKVVVNGYLMPPKPEQTDEQLRAMDVYQDMIDAPGTISRRQATQAVFGDGKFGQTYLKKLYRVWSELNLNCEIPQFK